MNQHALSLNPRLSFFSKVFVLVWVIGSVVRVPQVHAERAFGKVVSVAATAGAPDLLGLRIGFEKVFPLRFSLGFGLLPVNGILNQVVRLNPQPVNFSSTTDIYNLYPAAGYSVTSFGIDMRYHFASTGFFAGLSLTNLYFTAAFNARLQNETTGGSIANAISGSASIVQPMAGLSLGYEFSWNSGFFLNFMGGAALPLATLTSVSLGGTAAQAAPALSGGDASFNSAKASFQNALDQAVAAYRGALPVFPMATVQLGWIF